MEVDARCGESFSFSHASCTSALELSVALTSFFRTKEAKRRSSSYTKLKDVVEERVFSSGSEIQLHLSRTFLRSRQ